MKEKLMRESPILTTVIFSLDGNTWFLALALGQASIHLEKFSYIEHAQEAAIVAHKTAIVNFGNV